MKPLDRQEVIDGITGKKRPSRVPVLLGLWASERFYQGEEREIARKTMDMYPDDITMVNVKEKPYEKPETGDALDASPIVENLEELEAFLDSNFSVDTFTFETDRDAEKYPDRYRLLVQWYFLFENLWNIRGMTNALVDFYDEPEAVHRIFRIITDYYKALITKAKQEQDIDGFFISDDLGTQSSTFFSVDIFKEFFAPYYGELIAHCHDLGVHMWLHSCGNITAFLPEFINLGLDVIHPLQKYAMDEAAVLDSFLDQICFWYGMDVQKIIPFGTAAQVEEEIRRVYSLFSKGKGRFLFTCGNALTPDCPLDSFKTLYQVSHTCPWDF